MEIILYDSRSAALPSPERDISTIPVPTPSRLTGLNFIKRHKATLSRLSGRCLLFFATAGIIYASLPVIIPKIQSELRPKAEVLPVQTTFEEILKRQEEKAKHLQIQKEAEKYGVDTDFSIVIPKISASAKVIPNVNAADEEEYRSALKQGVAHAAGSKFPGGQGTIYLFAHSTNTLANVSIYNAIFYQLKELKPGDKIIIFFTGQKYIYQVLEQKIVEANDVAWLTNTETETLILQTCWPPGTSLKRLIVIAKQV